MDTIKTESPYINKLQQRMEAFLKDNEESLTDEERQKFLDAFLDGRHIDFSGVTAIRDFYINIM